MSSALQKLTDATATLADEAKVLELAVAAIHEACGRGAAYGLTSRGHPLRLGHIRILKDGAPVHLEVTHLAAVRTPAFEVANVPFDQRNRWVEIFREGIATPDGFKKSTLYPLVRPLGILDQGRISICAGAKQVAFLGAGVPEGTTFTDDERERLAQTSAALVVPMRMAALLAAASVDGQGSALETMLDTTEEMLLAVDGRGTIIDSSPLGAAFLRRERGAPERIRQAVLALQKNHGVVRSSHEVLHVSRCAEGSTAYLVVVDGNRFVEAPITLTKRQAELLEHLQRGLTNAEIGAVMGIAPSTVKTMLERLYAATGVANRVELLAWAAQRPRA